MKRSSILFGTPGKTWLNNTRFVRYQFFCSWRNTCGACAQYDSAIGPIWPIPIHMGCRCYQRAIMPGRESEAFTDFLEISRQLDTSQVAALVGRSNWRLIERAVVAWEDVVTPSRVRRFREVVARGNLGREALREAGVSPSAIEAAIGSVQTGPARLAAAERRALVELIEQAGRPREAIVEEVAGILAERVVIGPGPREPEGGGWAGTGDVGLIVDALKAARAGVGVGAFPAGAAALGRALATSAAVSEIQRRFARDQAEEDR